MNGRIRSIEFHIDTSPLIRKGRGFIHWLPGREQVSAFSQHSEELRLALRGMAPSPTPKRDHGDPQALRLRSEGLDDDGSGRGT